MNRYSKSNLVLSEESFKELLEAMAKAVRSWKREEDVELSGSPLIPFSANRYRNIPTSLSYWEVVRFSVARRKKILKTIIDNADITILATSAFWEVLFKIATKKLDRRSTKQKNMLIQYYISEVAKKHPRELSQPKYYTPLMKSWAITELTPEMASNAISLIDFETPGELSAFFDALSKNGHFIDIRYRGIGNAHLVNSMMAAAQSSSSVLAYIHSIPEDERYIDVDEYYATAYARLKGKEKHEQEKEADNG